MWNKMLIMKLLSFSICVYFIIFSNNTLATKEIDYEDVNFYTLAANETVLDGKKIQIQGWLEVWGDFDGGKYSVYLYPVDISRGNKNSFDRIKVVVDKEAFDFAKESLNQKAVQVIGIYSQKKPSKSGVFGNISKLSRLRVNPLTENN
ncbi:hypothetical protein [Shewanella psychromarinicola]|uniref:Uncharacterized protein n=1 Tax=Shewanella psychromarinicola TaxID=2487742 RepID=A0A3N4EJD9_9GAMM|nr:hypothetical protein [Shewanella psychromarinicola]AZG36512.1 hypothetical protein EGC80_17715 [Shewanella psychromarinicola]MCL1084483.1 hypothetical protein [Shewanella psychromarinicola]RPA34360.1 hypothetical protein EGC77_01350 [Shewanella psychromarinicola]